MAQDYIVNLGFKVGKITEENSEEVAQGLVISSDPGPKSKLKKNDIVNLVISKGSAIKYKVAPNLSNMTLDEAKNVLSVSNLKLGEATAVLTDDKSKDGKIFNQSIAPNTKIKEQEAISVNYYKYQDPDAGKITVPNFVGKSVKDAQDITKELGLNLQVNGDTKNVIEKQDKAPNSKVEKGTTITLTTAAKKDDNKGD
ncbi:Serine/threonine-protein kinase PK-1 [bioreactor metagenome]|uniref:Serine/threonine-protein kinase PK-1 n=1 Tax=bioreactor metagenome TaxID=1076179 RepID=A0A645DK12_9ZZZZ